MINFYPGPSKIYPEIAAYLQEGLASGIFSMNHRSEAFHTLYSEFKLSFKQYFNIPSNYEIAFVSSATEAWEIVCQSYPHLPFWHCYNGSFGKKWFTQNRNTQAFSFAFHYNSNPDIALFPNETGVICLTNNETSNGTYINTETIKQLRLAKPNALIAIDTTSALGGINIDFSDIDICFSSVQKCLGQAPGLAVLVLSPKAIDLAKKENTYYNDIHQIAINAAKNETTHTPNIPAIYTLHRSIQNLLPMHVIEQTLKERQQQITQALLQQGLSLLAENEAVQSPVVFAVKITKGYFAEIQQLATQHQLIIGKGYGEFKEESFRIANFPAHNTADINQLLHFIKHIPCL